MFCFPRSTRLYVLVLFAASGSVWKLFCLQDEGTVLSETQGLYFFLALNRRDLNSKISHIYFFVKYAGIRRTVRLGPRKSPFEKPFLQA